MALAQQMLLEEVVLKSDKPVMVDFWAAWCGPCRMVGPIIDEPSTEYEGKVVVGKLM
jgi:thioredoxin 1